MHAGLAGVIKFQLNFIQAVGPSTVMLLPDDL